MDKSYILCRHVMMVMEVSTSNQRLAPPIGRIGTSYTRDHIMQHVPLALMQLRIGICGFAVHTRMVAKDMMRKQKRGACKLHVFAGI